METQKNHLHQIIEQAQSKIRSLQKVNFQLTKIIQLTEISQYKELLTRLSEQQKNYSNKINDLNLKISHLQTQLSFQESRHANIVSDLSSKAQNLSQINNKLKETLSKTILQNKSLKKQLSHRKTLIKNQENLIDQYKSSVEQEKEIQKEISKCEVKQIQTKLKKSMEKQIEQMKSKYQKQISKLSKKRLESQYQKEVKSLGQYLTEKKSNASKASNQKTYLQTQDHCFFIKEGNNQEKENNFKGKVQNQKNCFQQTNSFESTLASNINNFETMKQTKMNFDSKIKYFLGKGEGQNNEDNAKQIVIKQKNRKVLGEILIDHTEYAAVSKSSKYSSGILKSQAKPAQQVQKTSNKQIYSSSINYFKKYNQLQNNYIIDEFRQDQFSSNMESN